MCPSRYTGALSTSTALPLPKQPSTTADSPGVTLKLAQPVTSTESSPVAGLDPEFWTHAALT